MKELFKVVNTADSVQKTLQAFENKQDAKAFRNKKNEGETYMRFRVCRGKHHWKGESFVKSKNVKAEAPLEVKEERKKIKDAEQDAEQDVKRKENQRVLVEPRSSDQDQAAG